MTNRIFVFLYVLSLVAAICVSDSEGSKRSKDVVDSTTDCTNTKDIHTEDVIYSNLTGCGPATCSCITKEYLDTYTKEDLDPISCNATSWPNAANIAKLSNAALREVYRDMDGSYCIYSTGTEYVDGGAISAITLDPITSQEADACIQLIADKCEDLLSESIIPECSCFDENTLAKITDANINLNTSCRSEDYPNQAFLWKVASNGSFFTLGYGAYRKGAFESGAYPDSGNCLTGGDIIRTISDSEAAACINLIVARCEQLGYVVTDPC